MDGGQDLRNEHRGGGALAVANDRGPLASEAIELACHNDHRLGARKAVELADLADETFVDFPIGWGVRTATDRAFAAAACDERSRWRSTTS